MNSHAQVRQVFRILCLMASPVEGSGNEDSEGAADLDDVHIFIRKHVAMSQASDADVDIEEPHSVVLFG